MIRTVDLPSEAATVAFGAALAPLLSAGDIVMLSGELGAGKTALARAAISALAGVNDVPSPTFTLVNVYEGPHFPIFHFDLYRLEKPEEIYALGIEEAFEHGVVFIEWPERAAGLLPGDALVIRLAICSDGRRASIAASSQWRDRMDRLLSSDGVHGEVGESQPAETKK